MDTTEAVVARIHRDAIVFVSHDHRPIGTDYPLMLAGGVTAKVYQVALDVDVDAGLDASVDRSDGWLRLATTGMEQALHDITAHRDQCCLATTAQDVRTAKQDGRAAIMLGAEGTRWLEGSLEPLRLFHRLGLRELQLTWAFPNAAVSEGRLSPFGQDVVQECRRLGILVDLTHIPVKAFYDVADLETGPLIVSHGSAAAVTTDLDDDRLRVLASTGGVLGIHFFCTYLGTTPSPEDVFKQVDYLAERIGIDHVAVGADFFPTEGPWRKLQAAQNTPNLRWAIKDLSEMPRITRCLVQHGYSEQEISKVLGLNFLRVCEQVIGS